MDVNWTQPQAIAINAKPFTFCHPAGSVRYLGATIPPFWRCGRFAVNLAKRSRWEVIHWFKVAE